MFGKLQNVGCIDDCHSTTEVKQRGFCSAVNKYSEVGKDFQRDERNIYLELGWTVEKNSEKLPNMPPQHSIDSNRAPPK